MEASGDVERLSTRTDTMGREQPVRGGAEVAVPDNGEIAPGQLPLVHPTRVEALAALQRNGEAHAESRRAYDEDVARNGSNPAASPPLSTEAERLRDALRMMNGGAKAVAALIELEPMISLPMLLRELPPGTVKQQIKATRSALDAVSAAFYPQQPIRPVPPPSDVIEMTVDPLADIEGRIVVPDDEENQREAER